MRDCGKLAIVLADRPCCCNMLAEVSPLVRYLSLCNTPSLTSTRTNIYHMKSIEIMLLATGHFPLPAGSQALSLMANIKLNILNGIKFPNSNKDFSVWSVVSVVWLPLAVLYV